MAVDLSVNLGGLKLKNPFLVASADIGCHLGQIKEAAGYGAGGFILKRCVPTTASWYGGKPRFRVDSKKGTFVTGGMRRLSLAEEKKLISDAKKEVKMPVGPNISAFLPNDEEKNFVVTAAKELCESGADFIELNTGGNRPDVPWTNEISAKYIEWVGDLIQSVKKVVNVPVFSKVLYADLNVMAMVREMENAGVDVIDMGHGAGEVIASGTLDIYNPRKPREDGVFDSIMPRGYHGGVGQGSAEITRAVAQGHLVRCGKVLHTPILACGGIFTWNHAVESIMLGATATASCSVYMVRGFEAVKKMQDGLRKFMEEQHYSSVEEMKGLLLGKRLGRDELKVLDAVASIDPEKCNGCGLCVKPAHCGINRRAISLVDGVAVVDQTNCSGCETCASICPVGAASMVIKK